MAQFSVSSEALGVGESCVFSANQRAHIDRSVTDCFFWPQCKRKYLFFFFLMLLCSLLQVNGT